MIIDGNALIHRAFHAIPPGLTTASGEPTNAVYGFASMLLNLLLKEKPAYIIVTYDKKGKTFRDELYAEYKATRVKAPQELYDQMPKIKEMVNAFKIPQTELEGFEADDLIATIVEKMKSDPSIHCGIVTGDRDTFQLVSPQVSIITPQKGFREYEIYTPEKVEKEFGITPEQFRDYKALRGDTSDNIPGVRGIGEVTATELLQQYKDIEGIYAHIEDLPNAIRKKMIDGKAMAAMSRELVTLKMDVPIDFDLEKCRTHTFNIPDIQRIFEHYEFRSLSRKLIDLDRAYDEARKGETNMALPLQF